MVGRDQPKILYTYMHPPWTQTIGYLRPEVGSRDGLKKVSGGEKGTYIILSAIQIFFKKEKYKKSQ